LGDKTYRVEIDIRAWQEIMRLGDETQNAVFDAIETLETIPRPSGCKKLKGEKDIYRIRSGNYRIVYSVHDDILMILIVKVGHRSQIYRKKN